VFIAPAPALKMPKTKRKNAMAQTRDNVIQLRTSQPFDFQPRIRPEAAHSQMPAPHAIDHASRSGNLLLP
jgi:hypothetical protein